MYMDTAAAARRLVLKAAGLSLLALTGCATGGAEGKKAPAGAPAAGLDPRPVPGSAPPQGPAAPPVPAAAPVPMKPMLSLPTGSRTLALTLDDGPDPRYTPTILRLLAKYDITATFCLVGENVDGFPGLVASIRDGGHEVANHTWSHPDLRRLPEAQVRGELERTGDRIAKACGARPVWFRAPGGDFSPVAMSVSQALGLKPLGWSVDPQDWARPGVSVITDRVMKTVRPGAIVLQHDGGGDRSQTVAALRAYLPRLIDMGYRFTTP